MDQQTLWEQLQSGVHCGEVVFGPSRARYEYLARIVGPARKVLNIGVGLGGLEERLFETGCDVFSIDPGEQAIATMREKFGSDGRFKVGEAQLIPFPDGEFDTVVMSEVLEHLGDDVLSDSVGEVRRVLKPGGRFIGTVPADEVLEINRCVCLHCGESFHRWGHQQSFSAESLNELLEAQFSNLCIERRHFSYAGYLNWKGKIQRLLRIAALVAGIHGSTDSFAFQAS
jgi:SAM-dependent methyltransferase